MTVLSDVDIAREVAYKDGLEIEPYNRDNLQPASYDLTLGSEFIRYRHGQSNPPSSIDNGVMADRTNKVIGDKCIIEPQEFVLGHTNEELSLPPNITAEVKGRSSIGRLGLIPHTAGFVDPGFSGDITLEFVNHSPHPIKLEPGMRCAQVVFQYTESPANNPYGEKSDSKYQGQSGVTESRIEQDQ